MDNLRLDCRIRCNGARQGTYGEYFQEVIVS
ncbi:hypothetical protein LMG28614_06828 [Paraburkholderia ultramafica]|uniref:Uncharacterized protein n=1 Tax=Paraburkholderia ultramafica TaxID=1544867 RepID=A0A6S7BYK3_9BURK|nr:hypothetical protein LMG28614_06828 [Paraburkholderia ultramafica]